MSIRNWMADNLGLKLLSLGLAIFLWAVVLGEQKVEVVVNIPFDVTVPPNLILANDPPETLQVRLRGPKTLVTNLSPSEVQFTKLPGKLVEGDNLLSIPPSAIQVPRGVQVLEVEPRRVRLVIEAMAERVLEVRARLEGTVPDGFFLRGAFPTPDRVAVSGPRNQLRQLTGLSTAPISLDGHTAPFSAKVALQVPGPQFKVSEGSSVTVQVDIVARRS